MALAHSPKIITDKLVLCLDARNTKSYPGSGTTWYDLSGNGYNGTMSDVTITSDGHMSFNGQNPGSAVAFPESNISKDPSGSAHIYETPQVYTLYDAIDLQSVGITTL